MVTKNFYKNFTEANYIIISTEWSFLDVLKLEEEVIPFLKENNKKIIITSNSPRFFLILKHHLPCLI